MEQAAKPAEAPKPKSRTLLLAVIIIVILVVVGVGVYLVTRPPPPPSGPQVSIKDDGSCGPTDASCYFTPSSINATLNGAAVVWTNSGTIGHTITTCDATNGESTTQCPNGTDATGLDSFNMNIGANGATVSHVFTKAGTYYYYCAIHPGTMHGKVVVT